MHVKWRSSIGNLTPSVNMSLALLLSMSAVSVQAADQNRLTFIGVPQGLYANRGLQVGDQILAVNGQRVSTEAAFSNRLQTAKNSSQSPSITVTRNGRPQVLNSGGMAPGGAGIMNASQMVVTSQGVMHKAAAVRLGLAHTPFNGGTVSPPTLR